MLYLGDKANIPSEKFGQKFWAQSFGISVAAVAAVAHDRLVTLTKACQQTNTPNTHTHSFSPYKCMVHGVFFTELSLEVGHKRGILGYFIVLHCQLSTTITFWGIFIRTISQPT